MDLPTFKKLPLGGVDRRAMVKLLAEQGPDAAERLLESDRAALVQQGVDIAPDTAVLLLGGSNGLTRALAVQLVFGESAAIVAVHYDSERMQIGPHHVRAFERAAAAAQRRATFFNCDAVKDKNIAEVVQTIRAEYRAVHLLNGIAAGSPKRHQRHGPIEVPDLDVAFDPVLQIPDFSRPEAIRRLGMVEVGVASENEAKRTQAFMGSSTLQWAETLDAAGLLSRGESVVAFCDYDFPEDDPVYAMGPLADAKRRQRRDLDGIRERFGVRAVQLCYPPMATTALGAIPGALLAYALSSEVLKERGQFRDIPELARRTMALWQPPFPDSILRLDEPFQRAVPEVRRRIGTLRPEELPGALSQLWGGRG